MIRSALYTLLFCFICIAASTNSAAQDPYAYVSSDSITVGDRFGFVIVAPRSTDTHIARPIFRAPTGASTIRYGDLIIFKSLSSGQKSLPAGSEHPIADTLVYEAATFALDTAYVPPLRLTLVQGSDSTSVATGGFEFPVVSLVDESMEDILDLADIASFPAAIWPWLLLAAVLIGVFLAVRYKDKLIKEKEPEIEEAPEVIPDPPFEEATKRFDILESKEFDAEQVKSYFVELTDIVRLYLSRRIHIPALESTSTELLDDLGEWTRAQNYDQPFEERLLKILATADLAKFADAHPAEALCADALEQSRKLVAEIEDLANLREKQARAAALAIIDSDDAETDEVDGDKAVDLADTNEVDTDPNADVGVSGDLSDNESMGHTAHDDSVASKESTPVPIEDEWERFKPT